ncbi:hypothetical protein K2224_20280 [Streptomyces sp. BHT-5-2]|uniref:hypothetical protein n=1 Tax=Streptomyces sp. BHT-5-2 TaxID=2866715 RepID=UPI001C8E6628|nr:hypothetical protein [Streptomyces sp. BHT-5-2]QZL05188.1 hypothetical protein K2224_20280 [Streptomyces sp. BHT-5-2]
MSTSHESVCRLLSGEPLRKSLDTADPQAWVDFDLAVRSLPYVRREALRSLTGLRDHAHGTLGESQLAVALCHPDGRVREAALEWAPAVPALLPLVVIRSADWVAPVREQARELLADLLPGVVGRAMAPFAALVLRMACRQHGDFAQSLLKRSLVAGPPEAITTLLTSDDRAARRFGHRLAVEQQMLSPLRLARIAASDDDVVIQDLCAEAALAAVREGAHEEVLEPLLESRQPQVRAAGVTALRRTGRFAQAESFLSDRSALVRACARWVLRKSGTDPLPLYRALCMDPGDEGPPPGAALGLAECGTRADAELLWPLTGHPVAAVRSCAVAGLRVLDSAESARLRPLVDDPAPAVAREVAAALIPDAGRLPASWLETRLDPARPVHTRTAAFRLLCAQGGVVELRTALSLLTDQHPKLRFRAEQSVRRWTPSATTALGDRELAALIDRHAPALGHRTVLLLRRQLGLIS